MQLRATLRDLDGNPLAPLSQHQGIEVVWPLNDSRTARILLSIYEDALAYVEPLKVQLGIEYGSHLLFLGPVVKPVWQPGQHTVELNAHDWTLLLKHHFHRYGDAAVDDGYPADGRGLRTLIESSVPTEAQLARGVLGNHLVWGRDTTIHQGAKGSDGAIWGKVERGTGVWDSMQNLITSVIGFDFDFQPVDLKHPPLPNVWTPGIHARVHADAALGEDRTREVVFHYGFGADNAEDFTYEPDGDTVRNYWAEVNPGGERNRSDADNIGEAHSETSWRNIGIYEGFESAGQNWPKSVLVARAKEWVNAYATPPDFFTVDPRPDADNVPALMSDYDIGDTITAACRVGQLHVNLQGRVVEARVTQRSMSGGANVSLTCVPNVDNVPTEGGELS